MAFFDALSSVEKEDAEVPNHLRDGNRDAEGFGHGQGYMYPHAYRDHWVAQQYLPDALVGRVFYTPSEQGYEKSIKADVLSRREIQIAAMMENFSAKNAENLTFSPLDRAKEYELDKAEKSWRARLDSNKAEILTKIRDKMLEKGNLERHSRNLVVNADDAVLIWALARKSPEGMTCGLCKSEKGKAVIEQYSRTLDELDRPKLSLSINDFSDVTFDRLFLFDAILEIENISTYIFTFDSNRFAPNAQMIIAQHIPAHGQHLSELILTQIDCNEKQKELLSKMAEAEARYIFTSQNSIFAWNAETIKEQFESRGYFVECEIEHLTEKRRLSEKQIELWFNEKSAYAKALIQCLDRTEFAEIKNLLLESAKKKIFSWKSEIAYFTIKSRS